MLPLDVSAYCTERIIELAATIIRAGSKHNISIIGVYRVPLTNIACFFELNKMDHLSRLFSNNFNKKLFYLEILISI